MLFFRNRDPQTWLQARDESMAGMNETPNVKATAKMPAFVIQGKRIRVASRKEKEDRPQESKMNEQSGL